MSMHGGMRDCIPVKGIIQEHLILICQVVMCSFLTASLAFMRHSSGKVSMPSLNSMRNGFITLEMFPSLPQPTHGSSIPVFCVAESVAPVVSAGAPAYVVW